MEAPPADGFVFVRYDNGSVGARGYLATDAMDVVYTPQPPEPSVWDAKVVREAPVLDRPRGRLLATIAASPPDEDDFLPEQSRWVEILASRGRWQHILFVDDHGSVVGWTESKNLRRGPAPGWLGGSGWARRTHRQSITLPRGTLFVGRYSDAVLGVVSHDQTFECVGECDTAAPFVEVDTCTSEMTLRARLPGEPPPAG